MANKCFFIGITTMIVLMICLFINNKKLVKNNILTQTMSSESKKITLEEAQEIIKMDCIGSDVGKECQWNNIKYSFLKPAN